MVTDSLTNVQRKGFFGYEPWLEQEIFQFQRQTYPHRSSELIAPRWRWMYVSSASRLGVTPMTWVYHDGSGVVAHQGAIPVQVQVGGEKYTTGWFVETMAHERIRGKAIGPMIIKKALEGLPFNLSLGQTEQMRQIQLALGWQVVAPLNTYVLAMRPKTVLRAKVRNKVIADLAAAALSMRQVTRRAMSRVPQNYDVREIERFDARHDRFWRTIQGEFPCAVVRDASFLNWKFVEQPGQEVIRLELIRHGEVAALTSFVIREPDSHYPYRRALLLDLLASPSDTGSVLAALDAVRGVANTRKAALVSFDVTCQRIERSVRRFGFIFRGHTRVFLVSARGLPERHRRLVLNRGNWFLSRADSDIDRPW
jgi:hypothetical protein